MADPSFQGVGAPCPHCDTEVASAEVRGTEIVLIPCGHTIPALSSLDVPPAVLEDLDG